MEVQECKKENCEDSEQSMTKHHPRHIVTVALCGAVALIGPYVDKIKEMK
ncbi:unnamed protein product [Cylicostephanus goldi]|uniref:Uncharacterized protein n=1 Tax=Cylicostephanus goldi TaxID=71465 RepID=A0A3P6RKX0_CYLGO|nr:unnamed protein product [Cylicostephanus goldi]